MSGNEGRTENFLEKGSESPTNLNDKDNKNFDNQNDSNLQTLENNDMENKNNQQEMIPQKTCWQKFTYYVRIPTFTIEKIIRLIIVTGGTIFMILNSTYGQAIAHFEAKCLDDMVQQYTDGANVYLLKHTGLSLALKLIMSILIDVLLIYTFLVWALFSKNLRYLTTVLSYTAITNLIKLLHKTVQPVNSSFAVNYFYSIFVNYQVTTRSFYSVVLGLLTISAFEWKRNRNNFMFFIFIYIFVVESILMLLLKGHYLHEVFTAGFMGHYVLILNEFVLSWIFGEKYLDIPKTRRKKFIDNKEPSQNEDTTNLIPENKNDPNNDKSINNINIETNTKAEV